MRSKVSRSGREPCRSLTFGALGLAAAFLFLLGCAHSRVRPPKIIERGELEYPLEAKLSQIEGDVTLGLDIDERGRVEGATIQASSGHPLLDEAALRYARDLRFRPAMIDDQPVRAHTELLLKFRLRKDKFDPDRWLDQVYALQAALKRASGEKRQELLKELLEAYVAFARFAQEDGRASLSYRVRQVVSPAVRQRWRLFWGNHPTHFAVLDDFLERGADAPELRSIAEAELLEMLVAAVRELRFRALTQTRDRRRREEMIATIEAYLNEQFPAMRSSAGPTR